VVVFAIERNIAALVLPFLMILSIIIWYFKIVLHTDRVISQLLF